MNENLTEKIRQQKITIIDKEIDYSLINGYLRTLWLYIEDKERGIAHDKIFNALGIDRYKDERGMEYEEAIDDIIAEAFSCCGESVTRFNECRHCDTLLNVDISEKYMYSYCEGKDWKIK